MDLYITKCGIVFTVLYIIYWFVLKNNTFHQANRMVLLLIMLSSLIIPLLELPYTSTFVNSTTGTFTWGEYTDFQNYAENTIQSNPYLPVSLARITHGIYFIVVTILLVRFGITVFKIVKLRKTSSIFSSGKMKLVYTSKNISPFTFFNWIFLPEDEFMHVKQHPIIEHERAHALQGHTFDLLFVEIFSIFIWFVPFVYSFKKAIKSVHEYLADKYAIEMSTNKNDYLQLLATDTEKYTLIGLSNNFYCKTIKKRISMITKIKSNNKSKFLYLLLFPAFVITALACSSNNDRDKQQQFFQQTVEQSQQTEVSKSAKEILFFRDFTLPIDLSQCEVSSPFGMRFHPITKKEQIHKGIDYKAVKGTPVRASADGVVIEKEFREGTYGNVVVIQHANGLLSLYAQLSAFKTEIGNKVKRGDVIGLVGSSGKSTGPHLHFELRKDGLHVNPVDYIQQSK